MNISINLADLRGLVADAAAVVPRKPSNPVLGGVFMIAEGGTLRAVATDTTATLHDSAPCTVFEAGAAVVDARTLLSIVSALDGQDVTLTADGIVMRVECGAAFKIPLLPEEDYPPITDAGETTAEVDGVALLRAFSAVDHAISQDDNRYGLNGAYVEDVNGDTLRIVATDGARLCYSELPVTGDLNPPPRTLIPRRAVADLKRLAKTAAGAWQVGMTDTLATFRTGALAYSVRLIAGEFPDYRQVLPSAFERTVLTGSDSLRSALRRAAIVADGKNSAARIELRPVGLTISAQSAEGGSATETIHAEVNGDGMVTGVNARYTQDALTALDSDQVVLSFGGDLSPIQITSPGDDSTVAIVMPMRLD